MLRFDVSQGERKKERVREREREREREGERGEERGEERERGGGCREKERSNLNLVSICSMHIEETTERQIDRDMQK